MIWFVGNTLASDEKVPDENIAYVDVRHYHLLLDLICK